MNRMIEFAKNNRTTTYFRDSAINEIRLAYRIMEYLAPDSTFIPKDLDEKTKCLIFSNNYKSAIERIIESEIKHYDCGSSSGYESFVEQGIELIEYLLPIYKKEVTDAKDRRRLALLEELKKLENTYEAK